VDLARPRRTQPGGTQPPTRGEGEPPPAPAGLAGRRGAAVRSLEVVPDDLVAAATRPLRVNPVSQALVELRPQPLRDRPVGLVADEDVVEAKGWRPAARSA
jgi:hypothetical protein